uniref:BAR domain-containing protein n=1 Tax=Dunaliella tertiolecta TaxID=3047 RepID=A0A7S3VMU7_DUNTE|mmetsp:Transcript_4633/g.12663  ORF Transcript_4633/g.12663 Transcript_4633/m.12663 type:complete len:367 (-) Transcript_4633:1098-2198(-)
MPSSFKRFGEKLKQQLNINSGSTKDWRPTSNARNLAMIEETKAFAKHLKLLQRELGGLMTRVEAALSTMRSVLAARLPRAFDETGAGVAPVDPEDRIVGVAVNHDAIANAGLEMKQRLTDEVIFPLQQWLAAYRSIKVSNKKVEEVRLDLDTKRRETLQLQERHAKLQGQNHKDADAALYKAQSEEDKMNRLAARYHEMEAEVFNALLTLISDTAVLRDYQAAALAIVQRCFTMAYTAFDLSATVPMPMIPNFQSNPVEAPPMYNNGQYHPQAAGYAAPPAIAAPGQVYPSQASPNVTGEYAQGIAPMAQNHYVSTGSFAADRPAAPSWFTEAKANAKQAGRDSDSGDENDNPFYGRAQRPSAPPI